MSSETSHRISIKVEAPKDTKNPNNSYRQAVFNIDMESALPLETIQKLTNDFFTTLVTTPAAVQIQVVHTEKK